MEKHETPHRPFLKFLRILNRIWRIWPAFLKFWAQIRLVRLICSKFEIAPLEAYAITIFFVTMKNLNFLIFLAISNKPQRVTVGHWCTIFSPGFEKRDDIRDKRPIALSARPYSLETARRTSMFLAYCICHSRYCVPSSISREQLGIIGNIRLYQRK